MDLLSQYSSPSPLDRDLVESVFGLSSLGLNDFDFPVSHAHSHSQSHSSSSPHSPLSPLSPRDRQSPDLAAFLAPAPLPQQHMQQHMQQQQKQPLYALSSAIPGSSNNSAFVADVTQPSLATSWPTALPAPAPLAHAPVSGSVFQAASGCAYRLLKEIGSFPASGAIWKAFNEKTDQIATLRFLSASSSPQEVAAEIENVRIVMSSPKQVRSVLSATDFCFASEPGCSFVVYEALAVRSLASLVDVDRFTDRIAPLPDTVARKLFVEMVAAVAELHAAGIPHRALSIASFHAESDYSLRLVSPGLARFTLPQHSTRSLMGPASCFLPPPPPPLSVVTPLLEPAALSDTTADVWSLGWLLVQLTTGESYYDVALASCYGHVSRSDIATLASPHIAASLPSFWAARALNRLSEPLINLVLAMLEPEAAKRASLAGIMQAPWTRNGDIASPAQMVAALAFRQPISPPAALKPLSPPGSRAVISAAPSAYVALEPVLQAPTAAAAVAERWGSPTTFVPSSARAAEVRTPSAALHIDPPPPYGAASSAVLGDLAFAFAPTHTAATSSSQMRQQLHPRAVGSQFTSPPFCSDAVMAGVCKRADCSAPHPPNTHWPSSSLSATAPSFEPLMNFGASASASASAAAVGASSSSSRWLDQSAARQPPVAVSSSALALGDVSGVNPFAASVLQHLEPVQQGSPRAICKFSLKGGVCQLPTCQFFHPPGTHQPRPLEVLTQCPRPRPAAGYVCHNCGDTTASHFKADCIHPQRCRYTAHGGVCTRPHCAFFHPPGTRIPPSGPFLPPAGDAASVSGGAAVGASSGRPRPAAGYVCHNCGDVSLSHFKAECPHPQRCRYTTHGGMCTRTLCQYYHPQ